MVWSAPGNKESERRILYELGLLQFSMGSNYLFCFPELPRSYSHCQCPCDIYLVALYTKTNILLTQCKYGKNHKEMQIGLAYGDNCQSSTWQHSAPGKESGRSILDKYD